MEIILWSVLVFALVYEPFFGYKDFQKLRLHIQTDKMARSRYYKSTMIGLWIPTLFILLVVFFSELSLNQIGIQLLDINTNLFGPLLTYILIGVFTLVSIILLVYTVASKWMPRLRQQLQSERAKTKETATFLTVLLPETKKEKKLWNYVSITAGVTEEIIYRGFLIFAFGALFPHLSIWWVCLAASVLFGLAHTYQGLTGVIRTTVIGFFFSMVYIALGSIVPLILFHALVDYFGKVGEE